MPCAHVIIITFGMFIARAQNRVARACARAGPGVATPLSSGIFFTVLCIADGSRIATETSFLNQIFLTSETEQT